MIDIDERQFFTWGQDLVSPKQREVTGTKKEQVPLIWLTFQSTRTSRQ